MGLLAGLAFLALLVTGLAGWGALLLQPSIRTDAISPELGLSAATGLCVYLALCGLLEAFGLATPTLLTAYLAIGALLWVARLGLQSSYDRSRLPTEGSWISRGGLLLSCAAAVALVANSASWTFVNTDDAQGYLVFVERILQTGSASGDPFSYRRFEAGLGGGNYVYALGGILGDTSRLRIVDVGGGLILLAALMFADLGQAGRSARVRGGAFAVLVAVVALAPAVNMTPEIIGAALVYAMARLFRGLVDAEQRWRRMFLVALFVSGLTCLKTPFVIPAAAFATALYAVLLIYERSWRPLIEGSGAAALALLFMAPWMIVSQQAVSTPFFPLLGVGHLSPLEVGGHAGLADLVKSGGRTALLLTVPAYFAIKAFRPPASRANLFTGVALTLCVLLLLYAQTRYTVAGYRYGYASAVAFLLFCVATWLREHRSKAERRVASVLAPLLLLNLALYPLLTPGYGADTFGGGWLYRATTVPEDPDPLAASRAAKSQVRRMQAAVPAGAVLLARTSRPYHLDFNRNRIFVMDWPGLIGPGRGPPASSLPDDWKRYLRASGVDFVAYAYRDEADMPAAALHKLIAQSESAFLRQQLSSTISTQQALADLRRSEQLVFDDGETAVIRLDRR